MGTPLLLPSLRASIENLKHHVDILVRMGHDEIMRSYGQNCALAKALDVVGDRWTLLIVRELMIRDRCRYTDLRNGLPGIATNLLAERLNEMEQAGLVTPEAAPPPIATTLFQLTNPDSAARRQRSDDSSDGRRWVGSGPLRRRHGCRRLHRGPSAAHSRTANRQERAARGPGQGRADRR